MIDLLDGDLYAGDPYADLRLDARPRARLLGRAATSSGASRATTTSSRSRRRRTSSSTPTRKKGGYRPNLPSDPSIIGLDDPLHTKRRKLVNRGFTPADGAGVGGPRQGDGRRAARRRRRQGAGRDRSRSSPAPLPAQMIGLLLGYPHEMWPKLMEWSERTIVGGGGPRYVDDDVIMAAFEFAGACSRALRGEAGAARPTTS